MKLNIYALPFALSLLSSICEAAPHYPFATHFTYATPIEGVTDFDQLYSGQFVELTGSPKRADGTGLQATNVAGYDFRVFSNVAAADFGIGIEPFTGQTPLVYGYSQNGAGATTAFEVAANDGKLFDLQSVDVTVDQTNTTPPTDIQLVGYRNGSPVSGATLTINMAMASAGGLLVTFNTSGNANFAGIDMFRITGAGLSAIGVDNINAINFRDLTVLPLKLFEFKGGRDAGQPVLSWKSENEAGLKSFAVERSINGNVFTAAGIITAANTTGTHTYSFTDAGIGNNNPVLYYRLRQNDVAGKVSFSQVISLALAGAGSGLQLCPNPVQQSATLTLTLSQPDDVQVIVTAMNGQQQSLSHHQLNKGIVRLPIATSALIKGMYTIEVKGKFIQQATRFIKE